LFAGFPIFELSYVIYGVFQPFLEDPVKPVNAGAGGLATPRASSEQAEELVGGRPERRRSRQRATSGGRPERHRSGRPEFEFVHACVPVKKKRAEKKENKTFTVRVYGICSAHLVP
jgi:hypothetical protein